MGSLNILNNYSEEEKVNFIDFVNTLLAQSVIVAAKESDKRHYRFYEMHAEEIQEYFLFAGWEVKTSENKVITLRNTTGKNKVNLTLFESTLLFIIYKLYIDQLTSLRLVRDVRISNLEIREQFFNLNIHNKLPPREKMTLALKKFQRHSILELVQGNWDDEASEFIVYDSIAEIITPSILKEMDTWINELNNIEEWEDNEVNK